jgi:signal transduction histidine kinase/DNA-binding response OmpR family regulator
LAGEKILVVDDHKDSLEFLTEYILQPNGYQSIMAGNGIQGLELALHEKPDLMIMDLRMPRMTGLEVLAALRERDVHIPVILMTFHGSEETAVQAFRLGARDYVIKPYEPDEMLAAINRALTEVRLRAERDELTEGLMGANEQLERRVKELDVLSKVGKSVTAVLDTEQLLNRIVDAGLYLTGAEEGSLLLIDEETGDLYMRAQRNLGERFARGFRVKVRDTIAGQVVRTGQPYWSSVDNQGLKVKTNYLVMSLAYIPLKIGAKVVGVLLIDNKLTNRPFTEDDIYLLSTLADYAAIAIEKAELYGQLKEFSEELEHRVEERTRELREAQGQLIQSEKLASVGKLAAGVAHEINNPIGVILGFAQVLLKRTPEDDPMHRPLSVIEREGVRCKNIVQDLLDFARQNKPAPRRLNVNGVIEAAVNLMEHQANSERVTVIKGYAPDLPDVIADENQLQQVFFNIVLNAYQAMPEGGQLRITSRVVGNEVQAIFDDSGTGIPQENMRHVFDPFFTTKEVGQGTGLGLSVSYGIVQQHGGTIEVSSVNGSGATFIVKLPAVEPVRAQEKERERKSS